MDGRLTVTAGGVRWMFLALPAHVVVKDYLTMNSMHEFPLFTLNSLGLCLHTSYILPLTPLVYTLEYYGALCTWGRPHTL